jgi:hypothetical protein
LFCLMFLNLVMVSRLGYLRRDGPDSGLAATLVAGTQLLALLTLAPGWPVVVLALVVIVTAAAGALLTRRGAEPTTVRCLTFVTLSLAALLLLGSAHSADWVPATAAWLFGALGWQLPTAAAWIHVDVVVFGLLILTNEVNLLIRFALHRLQIEPKIESSTTTDERQYNAGRVIGILERYLIFVMLVAGADYAAIAVVLAAKGFARFKQLDRREFAEYILVGTLASTLCAVLAALLVRAAV